MKKVLFIVDIPGWAYDDAAKNWQKLLKNEYEIEILYLNDFEALRINHKVHRIIKEYQSAAIKDQAVSVQDLIDEVNLFCYRTNNDIPSPVFDHKKYDGIYFFYHRALCDARLLGTPIPLDKIAIAINNEKWAEIGAKEEYDTYMKGVKILAGCNNIVINNFKPIHSNIFKVSQSIDPKIFKYDRATFVSKRLRQKTIMGWSGNFNNPIKNFGTVRKSCEMAKVKLLKVQDLSREELNKWYNKVDAVIIASKSEGGPLMLLEAGAVGLPVISTHVGLAREILKDGYNGLLVKQDEKELVKAISKISNDRDIRVKLGKSLQEEILKNWTYEARLDEIRSLLRELCC